MTSSQPINHISAGEVGDDGFALPLSYMASRPCQDSNLRPK